MERTRKTDEFCSPMALQKSLCYIGGFGYCRAKNSDGQVPAQLKFGTPEACPPKGKDRLEGQTLARLKFGASGDAPSK